MRIGLVRRQYAASGGAELYVQRLLRGFVERGHEPHLFAQSWCEPGEGVVLHSVQVRASRAERSRVFAQAVDEQLQRVPLDGVLSLERTLRQDVYRAGDGVHRVWLQRQREFSPWWKRPLVGAGSFHRNQLALEALTLNPANTRAIIVNSNMVRSEIRAHHDFPDERIHLIRNGVDLERMGSAERECARERFGMKPDEFVVAFVGSGWQRKGLHFLIAALRLLSGLPKVRLLVAGKGSPPRNAPARALFTGPLREVEQVYAAADLLVTLPMYEPSANVVAEALASGLPVVTSVQNGAAELLQEGVTGSVVANPADAEAVAQAMDPWIRRGVGHRLESVERAALGIERNVEETIALLEKLANHARS